jgi:Flp pilus assembly protein TadB
MIVAFCGGALAVSVGILLLVRSWQYSFEAAVVARTVAPNESVEYVPPRKMASAADNPSDGRLFNVMIGALVFGGGQALLRSSDPNGLVVLCLTGAMAGELYWRRRRYVAKAKLKKVAEKELPLVMERVVMAVGSGLDILPALEEACKGGKDPVSEGLNQIVTLAQGGLPVEEAIRAISERAASMSVKHALVHIQLAHQQGGEIVRPLKELSDATQLAYQEAIEEEISKLPVHAVAPLILTFAGLILCFLTVPLVQVSSLTSKVSHVAK